MGNVRFPPIADIRRLRQADKMTDKEVRDATVAMGRWHYDDGHDKTVCILGLTYDYWYALADADGQLEPDEKPLELGNEGRLYYPYFANLEGPGSPTLIQAKGHAQSMVRTPIRWD